MAMKPLEKATISRKYCEWCTSCAICNIFYIYIFFVNSTVGSDRKYVLAFESVSPFLLKIKSIDIIFIMFVHAHIYLFCDTRYIHGTHGTYGLGRWKPSIIFTLKKKC